jgi:hypothetical protein
MITGGTGNLPDYFQNMPGYSVVRPLSGVNRFQHFVSKTQPILQPHRGRQPMKSGEIGCLRAICSSPGSRFGEGYSVIMKRSGNIVWKEGGERNAA